MNHEASLAMALGYDEQEKLAAHFDSYSVDELAELLKEKKAYVGVSIPIYSPHQLRMQEIVKSRQREAMRPDERKFYDKGEEYTKGQRTHGGIGAAAGAALGGGIGAYMGHSRPMWGAAGGGITGAMGGAGAGALAGLIAHRVRKGAPPKLEDFQKKSSLMPMQQAPASKAYVQREQTKGGRFINRASDLLSAPKMASVQVVDGWARELAHEDIEKVSTGGLPSMGGLTAGISVKPPKPAGLGAMTMKPGSVGGIPKVGAARLRAEMDKMAFPGGGMLAAGINKAAPYLAKATRGLTGASWGQAAGIGAGVGAVGGAARHMLSGRDPQTGQKRTSLLGSMAGGAVLGAGAGAGLKAGAGRFQGSPLHARMTSGNFQFGGPAPQQGSLPLGGAASPGPVPGATPAAAPQGPGVMQRIRNFFGGGAKPAPTNTVADVQMGGGVR